jgi:hypothetical protein
MTTWYALGALALVLAALTGSALAIQHAAYQRGYEAHKLDMAERRAQRRHEARGRHRKTLAPFPGDTEAFERVTADTGELAVITDELSKAAESGDFKTIAGSNAAFFRRLDLRHFWTRAA